MSNSIPKCLLRDIPGWEQLYAVTCDGRVWAHPREWRSANGNRRSHNGMWLRPDASGPYLRVTLQRDRAKSKQSVHRLVAAAWLPNPGKLPEVNHKDGVKRNNCTANLEWCTRSENHIHAWRIGLIKDTPERVEIRRQVARKVAAKLRKLTMEQAASVRELHAKGRSINSLSKQFGIQRNGIKGILDGRNYAA